MAVGKLKRHKSSGIDQIPAEVMKPGGGGGTHGKTQNFIQHPAFKVNSIRRGNY
jgi:hypothetical protein